MKIIKHMAVCLLMFALMLGSALNVYAAVTYNGADGFSFSPGSEMSETTLFDKFEELQPGDSITQTIAVRNKAPKTANIYLRAIPHNDSNPLQTDVKNTETVKSMNDFLKQLHMKVTYKGKTIYSSTPNKTAQLTENYFLGSFKPGDVKKLKVKLTVPKELDNSYAGRSGEVDWEFLAEEIENHASISVSQEVISEPSNGKYYQEGEVIKYLNTVTNNGNTVLTNITVKESLTGKTVTIKRLKPGESYSFTTEYKVTKEDVEKGEIRNSLRAEGYSSEAKETVSDSDTTLVKTGVNQDTKPVKTGDTTVMVPYLALGIIAAMLLNLIRKRERSK